MKTENKSPRKPKGTGKPKGPAVQLKLQVENVSLTKVTVINPDGGQAVNYFTGGNVSLVRAQQIITDLIIVQTKKEAEAAAKVASNKGVENVRTTSKEGENRCV